MDRTIEPMHSSTAEHDARLEQFGYQAEMNRRYGKWDMLGFSCNTVNSWSVLATVFIIGIASGGPPVMIWGWLGVCFCSLMVAYSFAELCCAYPIAGGQYSWVAIMAPRRYSRPLSYVTGWIMNIGLIGITAANCTLVATLFLGIAKLNNPSYEIERWHNVLICYLLAISLTLANMYIPGCVNHIAKWSLWWNLTSFIVLTVTLLACQKNKQSARFVFIEFQNETGFESPGMVAMVGILQLIYSMACYDVPSKMTEDMKSPTRDGPMAIIAGAWFGTLTGFVYLVVLCFCIEDFQTIANSPTGVPVVQIYYDATHSHVAATILVSLIAMSFIWSTTCLIADTSRGLWAFARDHGLPASSFIAHINSTSSVPRRALVISCVVQMAINSIYFGSAQGFATIIALGGLGFYGSYAMATFTRLLGYFTGHLAVVPGAYSLGKWSPIVNALGLTFTLFGIVDYCFPQTGPVTAANMNYCSVVFGAFTAIATLTWFTTGRKSFTGPKVDVVHAAPSSLSTLKQNGAGGRVHEIKDDLAQTRVEERAVLDRIVLNDNGVSEK